MIIEFVLFPLKDGYTPNQLLEAADVSMAALRRMPGFLSRQLAKNEQRQWADLLHWNSLQEALAAAAVFSQMESTREFREKIDRTQTHMMHLEQLRSYQHEP